TTSIVKLATESRAVLRELREREKIEYDQRTRGILHFYRDQREFDAAVRVSELMRKHGCQRDVVNRERLVEIEPAFADNADRIGGGTYTAEDESGDALKYTQALAAVGQKMGAGFLYGSEAVALYAAPQAKAVAGVEVRTPDGFRVIQARDVIISMGSYSAPFLRRYGIDLRIYPAKGYSITIPIEAGDAAPTTSLTDDQYKLVYSNLGTRLRVA